MKITSVLVSQPRPAAVEKSPFYEVSQKCELEIEYSPLIKVEGVSLKEFRSQRIEVLDHTALIFTSRTTVDSFFKVCEQARITVPETMKYLCSTEAAIDRAKGYARPTKTDVVLPEDVAANLLPDAMYENCTNISDVEALNAACAKIAELWEREVLPLIQ